MAYRACGERNSSDKASLSSGDTGHPTVPGFRISGPPGIWVRDWRWLWPQIASYFGIEPAGPPDPIQPLAAKFADAASLYNTPPMFSMYVADLVLDHVKERGGLASLESANTRKAEKLYAILGQWEMKGFVKLKVQSGSRSGMNVTFEVLGEKSEQKFLQGAEVRGFRQLKGHR